MRTTIRISTATVNVHPMITWFFQLSRSGGILWIMTSVSAKIPHIQRTEVGHGSLMSSTLTYILNNKLSSALHIKTRKITDTNKQNPIMNVN